MNRFLFENAIEAQMFNHKLLNDFHAFFLSFTNSRIPKIDQGAIYLNFHNFYPTFHKLMAVFYLDLIFCHLQNFSTIFGLLFF